MSFSKRPDSDAVCYTKPLDSLKRWNDHFFLVDSFACPASFSWHTDKNVSRDPFPKSTEFSADDYAVLVAHPAPFRKFPEPLLCLIEMSGNYTMDEDTYPIFLHNDGTEMDLFAFIQVADPTKVKVGERERAEGEARLLDSTLGRVVPLLPVALARADSELEASVDRLFDEGGSADQGDSAAGGGQENETEIVTRVRFVADENVVTEKPRYPRKKRQVVTDASGSSHPPKKLRGDHGTSSGAATGVSATPEHESGVPADSIIGLNLRTIGASERSVVVPLVMTEAVVTSHAVNLPPVPETETYSAKQHLSMGSRELNFETLHQFFVLQWNVLNDSLLDDYDFSHEFVDHLASPALFSQIREMYYHHLFTEFNVGTARQACLNVKVKMRTEYCLSERKRLESECEKQAGLLKTKDDDVESLKAHLLLKETEAAEATRLRVLVAAAEATEKMHVDEIDALKHRNVDLELKDLNVVVSSLRSQKDNLVDQVHALETTCSGLRDQVLGYERLKEHIEEFQDAQMNIVNDKVAKLDADLLEMALHLEEKFYPHLLTTISGRRWLLTHSLKLADGLAAGIDHGKAGRSLADIVAYNPAAEADYNPALQRIREVEFPLLAELKSHKDASTADVMNLLRLEGPLADAHGMSDLQPDVERLTLPIHRPEDQVVLGETSLSFALSVTHSRVERIRENVAAQRSALIDVWVPLVDPLSAKSLIGEASTSGSVPATVVTTTALSTTFAAASSVPPITIKDYKIVGTDGPEDAQGYGQGNVASFPTVEFEKEELDTTPERDPPS
ncbi:hypothetical protein Tco_0439804 [Tanacetum coccineum]